ncbi:helix-turn-helix domain-containing protein [Alsobacter sp. SYSU M60028]|uniref:Helix-turn-helix domain-containing protein n=1 Tax=Alsobacter ponti TaxID=2962936 RepID=A0ABT1LD18_9HYPH|nr:helix-turn-helix domain-containing protein [Alsobacter ponti]
MCDRYGITDRTLARWLRDNRLNFPPARVVNTRRYFDLAELEAWERSRAAVRREAA